MSIGNRNKNNVVIKRNINFIVIDKQRLLLYNEIKENDFRNDTEPDYDVKRLDKNLYYPCLNNEGYIGKHNRCINIPFVNLRDFGLDGMLYFNDINNEFMNHKYFVVVKININITGFVSSTVLNSKGDDIEDYVSALHCQSGHETTYVYRLFPIKDSKINEIISKEPPLKRQRIADGKRKKKSKKTSKRKSSIKKKSIKKLMRKKSIKT